MWVYFDAQHQFITAQMNAVYNTAIANVKNIHSRTTQSISRLDSLTMFIVAQLQTCFAATDGVTSGEDVIGGQLCPFFNLLD